MKKPIKIIRRQERTLRINPDEDSAHDLKNENQIRREIGATIVSWIEERRQTSKVVISPWGIPFDKDTFRA
ncbi:MAG TPA: hypothetical protein VJS64_09540 [Pyrinomonadaceae bacterium]|nr:hypothetical protein [Pyrinomonadaceae bacterium]